jgi:hypothetical protein
MLSKMQPVQPLFLPPSRPADKANRSKDQAGQSSTSTRAGKLTGLTTTDRLSMSSVPSAELYYRGVLAPSYVGTHLFGQAKHAAVFDRQR